MEWEDDQATVMEPEIKRITSERKTLEALVYTPTTDRELLLAKLLAAAVLCLSTPLAIADDAPLQMPGSGFGAAGEGYFRLSAFNSRAHVEEAMRRVRAPARPSRKLPSLKRSRRSCPSRIAPSSARSARR